jgi:hypothetical protein
MGELSPDPKGVRRIKRDGAGLFCMDGGLWRLNLEVARYHLKLRCNAREGVEPPERLLPPRTYLYRRVYGANRAELFEICRTGTCLTMPFRILEIPDAPTPDQLQQLLAYIGPNLGLPCWGNKFDFGRFVLMPPRLLE